MTVPHSEGDLTPEKSYGSAGVSQSAAGAQFEQIVQSRRSIRRYLRDPIPPDTIIHLLEAGMHAPSPHNRQPWRFAVLQGETSKARLAGAMGERLRADRTRDGDRLDDIETDVARSRTRIEGAPVVLVASLTMRDMDFYPDENRARAERTMAIQSVGTAVQNIMLLAHALGLGSCWMCAPLFCPDAVRSSLSLPVDWEPQALVTLGYAASPGRERARLRLDEMTVWIDEKND